jgi:hypothetical protein
MCVDTPFKQKTSDYICWRGVQPCESEVADTFLTPTIVYSSMPQQIAANELNTARNAVLSRGALPPVVTTGHTAQSAKKSARTIVRMLKYSSAVQANILWVTGISCHGKFVTSHSTAASMYDCALKLNLCVPSRPSENSISLSRVCVLSGRTEKTLQKHDIQA